MPGKNVDASEKHLVGNIVLATLLVFALVICVYLVHQNRQLKQSSTKPKQNKGWKDDRKNGTHIYDIPDNSFVEQAQKGPSNYTDLKRRDLREQIEEHLYTHLNHFPGLYEKEQESKT